MGGGEGAVGGRGSGQVGGGVADGKTRRAGHRAVGGLEFEAAAHDAGTGDGGEVIGGVEHDESPTDRLAVDADGAFDGNARGFGEEAAVSEPVAQVGGPGAEHGISQGEAHPVGSGFIHVEFGGHTLLAAGEVEADRVLGGDDGVLVGLEEEDGRGLRRHAKLGADPARLLFGVIGAQQILARALVSGGVAHGDDGIDRHGHIGPGADLVDGVGGLAFGFFVEERGGHGGEVTTGGEADDADARGVASVLSGLGAHPADRALDVEKLGGVVIAVGAEAVVEDIGGDAETVEPAGDLDALMISREAAVAAAGADHEGGAIGLVFGGGPAQKEGLVLVLATLRAGSAIRPEAYLFRFGCRGGVGGQSGEHEQEGGAFQPRRAGVGLGWEEHEERLGQGRLGSQVSNRRTEVTQECCGEDDCLYAEPMAVFSTLATRAALMVVAVLLVGGAMWLGWQWEASRDGPRGMGLRRLLDEEQRWRREGWRVGEPVNERELWEIQETLAARAGISTAGLKGLVRRAVNAKDVEYQMEGRLLAGQTKLAAELARRLAASAQPGVDAVRRAGWLRRRADALWRGVLDSPAPVLREALELLPPEAGGEALSLRRELLADLASWHWQRAQFRPEDPQAEMRAGLEAVEALLRLEGAEASDQMAAWRMRGRLHLRLACALGEGSDRDKHLAEAGRSFEEAKARLVKTSGSLEAVRGALEHDLGVTRWEQGRVEEAVEHLSAALALRPSRLSTGGFVDVRDVEKRLNERLRTLAQLALAEARLAGEATADEATRRGWREAARRRVEEVHGLVLPEDAGPAWITAQAARLLMAAGEEAELVKKAGRTHYPEELAGEPGLPPKGWFD